VLVYAVLGRSGIMKLTKDDFDYHNLKNFSATADDRLLKFTLTFHDGSKKIITTEQLLKNQEDAELYHQLLKQMKIENKILQKLLQG